MPLSYYIQVIVSFLVLFGVLYGVLKYSKKIQKIKYSGEIEILDRRPVENGVSLVLLSVRKRELLVSVTGQSVSVLERFHSD